MRLTPRAATWSAKLRDGRQRVAGDGSLLVGDGAGGKVGVATADQAEVACDAAFGIGRGGRDDAGDKV